MVSKMRISRRTWSLSVSQKSCARIKQFTGVYRKAHFKVCVASDHGSSGFFETIVSLWRSLSL